MDVPVSFAGARGRRLFGILHPPAAPDRGLGVVVLNPGLKNRVAPNRINVKLARLLQAQGCGVLRFDPFGIGDSEGELADGNVPTVRHWSLIQQGLFVPDTLAAIRFLAQDRGVGHLALVGQCGAAVTAALAAARDARVDGLVLVDMPSRIIAPDLDLDVAQIEERPLPRRLARWARKALSPRTWRRLLRPLPPAAAGGSGFNEELLQALVAVAGRVERVALAFAERDFALKEYRCDLRPALERELGPTDLARFEFSEIKEANHVYTEPAWQRELFELISGYLDRRFPRGATAAERGGRLALQGVK